MAKIMSRVASSVIVAGFFIITVFVALEYESLDWKFYVIFVLIAVYIFLFGFAVGQNFASPIRKLLATAQDLSKGDLSSRIYLADKDELGELAKVFNKIAQDLEDSKTANETTAKSVDMKVKAKTQELVETIGALEQKVKNRTIELERIRNELNELKSKYARTS